MGLEEEFLMSSVSAASDVASVSVSSIQLLLSSTSDYCLHYFRGKRSKEWMHYRFGQ